MKTFLFVVLLFAVPAAFAASTVDAKLVAKLNLYIRECNGPGMEPKPKMVEFASYIQSHGFKDAKIECGVSNFGGSAPMMMIHLVDGGEIYVNYKSDKQGTKVSEIIEDSNTPEGKKRHVIWPVPEESTK